MSEIKYPHNVILKIEGNSRIDYDYVVRNFNSNFKYMLQDKKGLFKKDEMRVFICLYQKNMDIPETAESLGIDKKEVKKLEKGLIDKLKTVGCRKYLFVGKEKIQEYEDLKKEYEERIEKLKNGASPYAEENRIEVLDLPNAVLLPLKRNGVITIGDIKEKIKTWPNLTKIKGMGVKKAELFMKKINKVGIHLEYE